jgi:hypothetical protein
VTTAKAEEEEVSKVVEDADMVAEEDHEVQEA